MPGTSPGMTTSWLKSERALQRVGEIGPLPGEAAVLFGGAAKVTIGRGAAVDRAVELQRAADVGRRQAKQLGQDLLELLLVDLAGAVGIDQHRHRVGDADGVSDLDGAALG